MMIQKVARAIFFAQNWREMPKDGDPEAEAAWTDGDSALQAGGDPCFLLRAEAIHLARAALTALREHEIEHVGMVPFLLKMQEYGFGSDQLEVMVGGNPDHRIRPGGLKAALADFYTAALDSILSEKSPDNG